MLSTGEADYTAAAEEARALLWIKQLAHERKIELPRTTILFIDNAAADTMDNAKQLTTRSKHIETKTHFIAEQVLSRSIGALHTLKSSQIADILTKPLPRSAFEHIPHLIHEDARTSERR